MEKIIVNNYKFPLYTKISIETKKAKLTLDTDGSLIGKEQMRFGGEHKQRMKRCIEAQ